MAFEGTPMGIDEELEITPEQVQKLVEKAKTMDQERHKGIFRDFIDLVKKESDAQAEILTNAIKFIKDHPEVIEIAATLV